MTETQLAIATVILGPFVALAAFKLIQAAHWLAPKVKAWVRHMGRRASQDKEAAAGYAHRENV